MKYLTIACFMFVVHNLTAQTVETCGDNFDNNNNNLVDCADPDCAANCTDAFPCLPEPELYQVRSGNQLWVYDVTAAQWQQVSPWNNLNTRVNAIGYNVQDGYIYGIRGGQIPLTGFISSNELMRISKNGMTVVGAVTNLPVPPGSGGNNFWHSGDMDLDGNLYVSQGGQNTVYRVNVATLTAVALPIVGGAQLDVADFTRSAQNGKYYGYSAGTDQVREFIITGNNVTFQDFTVPGFRCETNCGATFSIINGTLYFYCNADGILTKLEPDDAASPSSFIASSFPAAQIIETNDGASCPLASDFSPIGDCCERVLAILEGWGAPPGAKNAMKPALAQRGVDKAEVMKPQGPVLHQNKPNPFNERTVIAYDLKGSTPNSALICIFDMNGTLRSTYTVPPRTDGQITLEGGTLRPGMYLYSLILDDVEVDTKRMILLE